MSTTTISISGMHCASCKALIEDVAGEMPGVTSCSVDVAAGRGVIEHDERFNLHDLAKEIESLGEYRVSAV